MNTKPHYNSKNVYFLRFHRISKALLYRPYYDNQRVWQRVSGYQATGTAIQDPFTFYYVTSDDWSSSHSYQFWNKNFTAAAPINNTETLKTIYSPSPSGFVEPKTAAFTGITSTGGNTSNSSQFNVSGSFNKGWNFYTNGWKTGGTIFFPALGFRDAWSYDIGIIKTFNSGVRIGMIGAKSAQRAYSLIYDEGGLFPSDDSGRCYGLIYFSVKE